jgi:phage-related protein
MRRREVEWVGSSRENLRSFPAEARVAIGHALHVAQMGGHHPSAKPLVGFRGAGVLELVEDYDGDTYRAVYTLRFAELIYVLHSRKSPDMESRRRGKTHA